MNIFPWTGPAPLNHNDSGFTPADGDGLPTTEAHRETTLRISYTDRAGQLQFAVVRLTAPAIDLRRLERFRSALKLFFYVMGGKLLTLELGTEHNRTVRGLHVPPRLHVIKGALARAKSGVGALIAGVALLTVDALDLDTGGALAAGLLQGVHQALTCDCAWHWALRWIYG